MQNEKDTKKRRRSNSSNILLQIARFLQEGQTSLLLELLTNSTPSTSPPLNENHISLLDNTSNNTSPNIDLEQQIPSVVQKELLPLIASLTELRTIAHSSSNADGTDQT